jgi:EpsI family protein
MPGSKRKAVFLLPVFLGAQALAVRWAAGEERVPFPPDLSKFPGAIANWKKVAEDQIDPAVEAQLRADRLLSWSYVQPTGVSANLFVGWFASQRGGASQPHSPQVCLPGSGWISAAASMVTLNTALGTIPVNRYVVSKGAERAVTIYWYQTPRRVLASEWAAKFWVVPDAFRDRRTDTALVRVFVWNSSRSDEETAKAAMQFSSAAYPLLREILPR